MPKARIIDEENDALARQAEELAALNDEEGGEVFRVTDELRGSQGVELMIIRLTGNPDQQGFCGMMPVAEFSHDNLKRMYGPGRYKVRIQGPKGFLPGGGTIKVAAPLEMPHSGNDSGGGDFRTYLEFVKSQEAERNAKTSRLLELGIPALGTIIAAIMNRPTNPGPDVAALVTALKPAPGPSMADLTTAMMNLKSLSAPEKTSDPIDTVLKVFEAARDMSDGGKGGGSTNWLDIVKEAIAQVGPAAGPVLQGILARGAPRAGAGVPTPPTVSIVRPPVMPSVAASPPTPGTVAAVPVAQVSAGDAGAKLEGNQVDMLQLMKPMIVQKLKLIAQWAAEKKDPQLYAEILLREHVPANVQDYIPPQKAMEYLRAPNWFQAICNWEPTLTPHQVWCNSLREELMYWISQSTDEPLPEPENTADEHQPDPPYTGIDAAS